MSPIPTKQKALLLLEKSGNFDVLEVDVPKPGAGEILVENHSASLNPVDWVMRRLGMFIQTYPAVLGADGAGIVKQVGEGVTTFAVGDKLLYAGAFGNRHATFQQYSIIPEHSAAKIPDNLTFDEAAAVPTVLATAAFGLYSNKAGGSAQLTAPWEEGGRGKYAGQTILITGGSSSVGQHIIQLARLSGFSPIITTASVHNEALLKSLGATHVVDRHASLADAVRAITSEPLQVIYNTITEGNTQKVAYDLLAPGGVIVIFGAVPIPEEERDERKRIAAVFGSASDPAQKEIAVSLYSNLTKLLASGDIKPNRVEALPNGLAGIEEGLKRLESKGISALKLVAHPQEL